MTVEAETDRIARFYHRSLNVVDRANLPFLLAGAYALQAYTGVKRHTKDLDLFCTPEAYPHILRALAADGYRTEITDANWLAKAFVGDLFVDVIFASGNGQVQVKESWFRDAPTEEAFGVQVKLVPVTELIYSKLYIASRERYDGADISHLILRRHADIRWDRLLSLVGRDWQLLLARLLIFQWVYPSERDAVPPDVLEHLLERQRNLRELPVPKEQITRGPLLSRYDYRVDVDEWGFKTT